MEGKKDNKGQNESNSIIKDTSLLNAENSPPFLASLLVKRSEKVATAAYLLTEHIEADEPLRGRIRSLSLELLKDMNAMGKSVFSPGAAERGSCLAFLIGEVVALIDIAVLSRLISEGNGALLKKELSWLREMLQQISDAVVERAAFPKDLFEASGIGGAPEKLLARANIPAPKDFLPYKGQKERTVLYGASTGNRPEGRHEPNGAKQADRREVILKLVRKEKLLSIKDIYGFFTGVSEKTIQRELTKMVGEGVLVRKGDKRWSKYALAGA
ncbi:MAG: DeoR family transcriptional regulator [bacterium]|nr:DeoR family transcriptional regulator [bacterium]